MPVVRLTERLYSLAWTKENTTSTTAHRTHPSGNPEGQNSSYIPNAEAQVRSRVSLRGICGGQSGTGTGFFPSTSVFLCQFYSTGAPLLGKGQTIIIIIIIFIFIAGLRNKPQGCGASLASAAGPFTAKKIHT
jgi:uncharacterized membrane protein